MGLNDAKICQIKVAGSSGTYTTLTGTSPSLPVGIGTNLSRTNTTCPLHHGYQYHSLVPVPLTSFCPENVGFLHFSSTNLLQSIPYRKSTMESTQNNSKDGLESMKTLFSQVRDFSQIENHKKMRLGFDFLTLASSNLLFQVVRSLRSKKWGAKPTKT